VTIPENAMTLDLGGNILFVPIDSTGPDSGKANVQLITKVAEIRSQKRPLIKKSEIFTKVKSVLDFAATLPTKAEIMANATMTVKDYLLLANGLEAAQKSLTIPGGSKEEAAFISALSQSLGLAQFIRSQLKEVPQDQVQSLLGTTLKTFIEETSPDTGIKSSPLFKENFGNPITLFAALDASYEVARARNEAFNERKSDFEAQESLLIRALMVGGGR
jgi:hypothetical protein